jgi:hypothetical protein
VGNTPNAIAGFQLTAPLLSALGVSRRPIFPSL